MIQKSIFEKSKKLRESGYSYSYISQKLNISKSTLSHWLREIEFKPNEYTVNKIGQARVKSGQKRNAQKIQSISKTKKFANLLRVANSDLKVIQTAIVWFEKCFGIKRKNFRLAIHVYPDNNIGSVLKFWSKETGIPLSQFGKTQVDKRVGKKSGLGKLKYGTAHLTVIGGNKSGAGVDLYRKIEYLNDNILNKIISRV
jgi:transcriptional regulator with XRE-family HTH domain